MTPEELAALAGEIRQRLDAVGAKLTDEALDSRITAAVTAALTAEQTERRKLRFGDSRLAGSKYGRLGLSVADLEFTHQLLTSAQVVGRSKGPTPDLDNAFKALSEGRYEDVVGARMADQAHVDGMLATGQLNRAGWEQATAAIDQVYRKRAMDTAESGYGSQLVGAQYIGELWAGARVQSRVFALLPTFNMEAPTAYLPVAAAVPELYFVGESTTYNEADYGTVKTGSQRVQVDAKKFVIHQKWSGEMEEDSILPFVPFLREQQVRSLAHYSDSLVLNGDTTNAATGNINLDDANPADTKHYLAFDGIRHAPLVDNSGNATDAAASLTYTKLLALKGLMVDATYLDDWGHPVDPTDLAYVVNPDGADEIADLDEVITVDKYGQLATVLTGEVAHIGRHPLIASIAMSKTEADGKVSTTGGNNTKDQVVAFNRRGFIVGIRRALKIETERLPGTDQTRIILSTRLGFGRYTPTGAASGIEAAAVLYDI